MLTQQYGVLPRNKVFASKHKYADVADIAHSFVKSAENAFALDPLFATMFGQRFFIWIPKNNRACPKRDSLNFQSAERAFALIL